MKRVGYFGLLATLTCRKLPIVQNSSEEENYEKRA